MSSQTAFRFRSPGARRSDPLASHEALTRLEKSGRLGSDRQMAQELVERHPGMTATQLAALALPGQSEAEQKLLAVTLRKRLPDLRELGTVYSVGEGTGRELRWFLKRDP